MQPTVGRIVHYHQDNGPYPAIITALNDDGTIELVSFGRNSVYHNHSVPAGDPANPVKGTWTWPPRS